MNAPEVEQNEAVNRIATTLHAPDAVTPVGRTKVNYLCASDSTLTLGDVVAATGADLPDHDTPAAGVSDETRMAVVDAAEEAAVALLSYDYRTLDQEAGEPDQYMSAAGAADYQSTFDSLVRKQATDRRAVVEASSRAAALSGIEQGRASVLLFVNQTTTSTENGGEPQTALHRVQLRLVEQDVRWVVDEIATDKSSDIPEPDPDRVAAMDVAAEFFTTVNNFNVRDADGLGDRLEPLMTESFAADFAATADDIIVQVKQAKLRSTGEVLSTGVADIEADTATVLVSGDALAKSTFGSRPRNFRWSLSLQRDGDTWLVANFTAVS